MKLKIFFAISRIACNLHILLTHSVQMPQIRKFLNNLVILIRERHLHYRDRGFYRYIGLAIIKIIFFYIVFLIVATLVGKYLLNFNHLYTHMINSLQDWSVILIFFISESFLGMIPPDLFVVWSAKFESIFLILTILGILSYLGGIISYQIGTWIAQMPIVKSYTERALEKYIIMVQKWGGVFIIVAALFPFSPFSMIVIAVSLLRYPFRYFLLYGLTRITRFLILGFLYIEILDLRNLLN